jgi:EH domain-containing protein 1
MVFETVSKKYNLNIGDFPPVQNVQDKLRDMDFSKFSRLKTDLIDELDEILLTSVPRLLESLPGINSSAITADGSGADNLLALLGPGLLVIKHGKQS